MSNKNLSDSEAKKILQAWPNRPMKLFKHQKIGGFWLRAQPPDKQSTGPTIVTPGSSEFKTQPDGLWLYFDELDCVDVIAVEVCGQNQNLNDKRSRYMPTTHALLVKCSSAWLMSDIPLQHGSKRPRWKACKRIAKLRKDADMQLPVRHLRILYALPNSLYNARLKSITAGAHEFFCPHSSLGSHTASGFREFLNRMMPGMQYYRQPK